MERAIVVYFAVWCLVPEITADGVTQENEKLYLLSILPYPITHPLPSWDEGYNLLSAAYFAVDMINQRDDVLQGYQLELINEDGGCDIANRARISFVRHVIAERGVRPIVGIIGPGCSTSTLAVSSQSSHPDISLINLHLAGTPLLQNRTSYGYSLGLLGASYGFVHSAAALMRKAQWTRIAVLYDEGRIFFRSTYQELERDLRGLYGPAEIAYTSAVYDTHIPLEDIQALEIRVIMVFTGPEFARKIMCLAHKQHNLHYPRFQFVWMGRNISEFTDTISFNYNTKNYTCSSQDVQYVIYNSIFVNYLLQRGDDQLTKANITYNQFWDMYSKRAELYNNNRSIYEAPEGSVNVTIQANEYATLVFDAIWAIALALSKVKESVNLTEYGLKLGSSEQSNMIRDHLYNNIFEGVSGRVIFNSSSGYTERNMEIGQGGINNTYIHIGSVISSNFSESATPVLVEGEFHREFQLVIPEVAGFFAFFTILGVVLILITHVITIVYRKHPSVKANSPKFNFISYIGAYIFAVGTLVNIVYKTVSLDTKTYGNFCQTIWAWFFSISFTIFFAPICARTWRLYRIFTHYLNPGPLISDRVLFSFIGVCVGIDVILATLWTALDPFYGEEIPAATHDDGDYSTRLGCNCQYVLVWYGLVYFLKVILLLATVVLSLLTRNISSEKFNTSYLRVFVYLFALTMINGLLMYTFLAYQNLNIHADYAALVMMCNTILFLSLIVFLPPIYPIIRRKFNISLQTMKYHVTGSGLKPHSYSSTHSKQLS